MKTKVGVARIPKDLDSPGHELHSIEPNTTVGYFAGRDSQNGERNRQNIIQQVNQRRIHENSTLYILNQRLF